MSTWTNTYAGGARIEINRSAFGRTLIDTFGHVLDARARAVAMSARTYVPNGKQYIDAKGTHQTPRELWAVDWRRGRGNSLIRGMEIPVALVVNNSFYAQAEEFGGKTSGRGVRRRKSPGASRAQVRQTRPVYRAARGVGGGTLVWKPKKSRRVA